MKAINPKAVTQQLLCNKRLYYTIEINLLIELPCQLIMVVPVVIMFWGFFCASVSLSTDYFYHLLSNARSSQRVHERTLKQVFQVRAMDFPTTRFSPPDPIHTALLICTVKVESVSAPSRVHNYSYPPQRRGNCYLFFFSLTG